MSEVFEREIGGRILRVEAGKVAGQANGAVLVRYGDSVVLVTAVMSDSPREGIDFFPLTVDYEERLYAAGKIPGGWFRREGRPSTSGILTARLTDRPLRPLFPKGMRNDVQIVVTTLSADQENDLDILSIVGASCALTISDIPFLGPISGTRIGYRDGEFLVNPTFQQLAESDLDIVVAGSRDAIVMVEAGASELSEENILEAMRRAQEVNAQVISLQDEMRERIGKPKAEPIYAPAIPDDLKTAVVDFANSRNWDLVAAAKDERAELMKQAQAEVVAALGEQYDPKQLKEALDQHLQKLVRDRILNESSRPDGRKPDEIRPISCEVGLLPRTHGTGLFTRGETQVLTILTLGSMGEQQRLDGIEPEETRRYIHHYNFPPFSVGEARPLRGASRRDIGHGALAERALFPVVPNEEEFPYTIRLVSEVLSSNGSTSMASTCGSTLALLDGGVPIKKPVAGIAMGLIKGDDERYQVLTDIAGAEDHYGDMDFKVAGTREGITALQMDIKIKGITYEILERALAQAQAARLYILDKITATIAEPRGEMSPYAPRMYRITVPQDKIGAVIGPGGRVIRSIIEETKCSVDIEDDGTVFIGSPNEEMAQKAISIIESLTKDVELGETYTGTVTRLTGFGAFVEILPGKDGLVRVEDLADHPVSRPEEVVQVGDELEVMVIEVDSMGRVNLSHRAVLAGLSLEEAIELSQRDQQAARAARGAGERGGRGGGERGGRGFGGGGGGRRGGGGERGGNGRPRGDRGGFAGGGGGGGQRRGGGGGGGYGQRRGGGGADRGYGPSGSGGAAGGGEQGGFRREPGSPPPPPPPAPMRRW
ncbi:MAG TPA: polyribonucleotide nucleotidyltransferase [Dehalococcoidia bacterium]|nr:polyribonucleotide nucleotidyltransferase [Dehalococcoidia bacterium]